MSEILDSLVPLFEQAEREGLWFYCPSQDSWFSPTELREKQAKGLYMWGACNWRLRNPQVAIDYLVKQVDIALENLCEFRLQLVRSETE
jgi:hypothetical protein